VDPHLEKSAPIARSIFARTGAGNGCPPPDAGVTISPAGASPLRCTGPKSNASRSPAARSCAGGPLLARLATSALLIDEPLHCAGKLSTSVRLPGIATACVIEPDNDDARYPCSSFMTHPAPWIYVGHATRVNVGSYGLAGRRRVTVESGPVSR
jgi:hypothetical protein